VAPILTIPAAARLLLGMSRTTLWLWVRTLPEWQACVASRVGRRFYLSSERMRRAGLIGAES
jgi:hypothetical protein